MSVLNPGVRRVQVKGSSAVLAGEKIVAAAATPEALAASTSAAAVTIQAKRDNLGSIYLGGAAVQYVELTPGQSISVGVSNLNLLFVAVASDGDGVNYLAVA